MLFDFEGSIHTLLLRAGRESSTYPYNTPEMRALQWLMLGRITEHGHFVGLGDFR
jgi:hypothetical protein